MNRYFKYVAFIVLIVGLMACGDDSTGPDVDPGDAPEFPQVQNEEAKPDFSFFEDNQPKVVKGESLAETSNYYDARSVALANQYTFAFANVYSGFLLAGSNEDADFEDGMWVWAYSYSYQNETVSIKTTAEEVANGYQWAMYWSYDDGETSFEDYKVMEGIVSEDGSSGEWKFNILNPDTNEEVLAYNSEWEVISDTENNMSVKWYDETGNSTLTVEYNEDQPEFYMTFTYPDESDVVLFWNTDTNEGYYDEGGDRRCWDENFEDISCS
ncbi:hypothetical protein CK503_10450 [Aliifodinibius salipaludis]|uniref:Uncharacterized protein n=1 Tax=Fodinibius salipaludis TaxID=2032627 RepID=A0A2A2G8D0_9BACT|nr:hypothetical protein [Aliifodinibius salipaludis]PAU93568.1 hypothetical protein CK503_10450 [Aliifodinibius salipaludis]